MLNFCFSQISSQAQNYTVHSWKSLKAWCSTSSKTIKGMRSVCRNLMMRGWWYWPSSTTKGPKSTNLHRKLPNSLRDANITQPCSSFSLMTSLIWPRAKTSLFGWTSSISYLLRASRMHLKLWGLFLNQETSRPALKSRSLRKNTSRHSTGIQTGSNRYFWTSYRTQSSSRLTEERLWSNLQSKAAIEWRKLKRVKINWYLLPSPTSTQIHAMRSNNSTPMKNGSILFGVCILLCQRKHLSLEFTYRLELSITATEWPMSSWASCSSTSRLSVPLRIQTELAWASASANK